MDYWVINALESAVFIGIFLLSTYLLVPKTIQFWNRWKETKKEINLSNAIACGFVATSLLAANFIMFIRAVLGV